MVTRVLATTGEISLKGDNRRWFEATLTANVRRALVGLPVARVDRPAWRVLVCLERETPFIEVARRLGTVFGISAIMPVYHLGRTLEEAILSLAPRLEGMAAASFAIRATRSDKRFPHTSMDVERMVGAFVAQRTGWRVDLGAPELTLHLLLDTGGIWLWQRKIEGPGGLPVGVGGRGLALLSGGIDSPVAARAMLRRGMRLDFVHFHSVPQSDPASLEKVRDVAGVLGRHQGAARLAEVPLLAIQQAVVAACPPALRVLLYRRFMFRLANRIARRFRAVALVTGESLGQVASQTVENLAAVEAVTSMPVLRPLIGLDKREIIAIAQRAGTYDISIRPHFDCCSFLVPDHPSTRSSDSELTAAEAELDLDGLVRDALRGTFFSKVGEPAPWDEIPPPPGSAS